MRLDSAAPMAPLAWFGIENDGVNTAVGIVLLFLVALWLALVAWTYTDARRRVEDPLLVGTASVASLIFPFIGTVIYMIVRPPEYLDDVRERELEIAAAEARLHQLEQHACPYCGFEVEKAFLRCPSCLRRLKEPCSTCGKPLDPRWKICPYCESEISGAAAPARAGARRAAASAQGGARRATGAARPDGGSAPAPGTAAARPQGARAGASPAPARQPAAAPAADDTAAQQPRRPAT
jgi:hypothetical protein